MAEIYGIQSNAQASGIRPVANEQLQNDTTKYLDSVTKGLNDLGDFINKRADRQAVDKMKLADEKARAYLESFESTDGRDYPNIMKDNAMKIYDDAFAGLSRDEQIMFNRNNPNSRDIFAIKVGEFVEKKALSTEVKYWKDANRQAATMIALDGNKSPRETFNAIEAQLDQIRNSEIMKSHPEAIAELEEDMYRSAVGGRLSDLAYMGDVNGIKDILKHKELVKYFTADEIVKYKTIASNNAKSSSSGSGGSGKNTQPLVEFYNSMIAMRGDSGEITLKITGLFDAMAEGKAPMAIARMWVGDPSGMSMNDYEASVNAMANEVSVLYSKYPNALERKEALSDVNKAILDNDPNHKVIVGRDFQTIADSVYNISAAQGESNFDKLNATAITEEQGDALRRAYEAYQVYPSAYKKYNDKVTQKMVDLYEQYRHIAITNMTLGGHAFETTTGNDWSSDMFLTGSIGNKKSGELLSTPVSLEEMIISDRIDYEDNSYDTTYGLRGEKESNRDVDVSFFLQNRSIKAGGLPQSVFGRDKDGKIVSVNTDIMEDYTAPNGPGLMSKIREVPFDAKTRTLLKSFANDTARAFNKKDIPELNTQGFNVLAIPSFVYFINDGVTAMENAGADVSNLRGYGLGKFKITDEDLFELKYYLRNKYAYTLEDEDKKILTKGDNGIPLLPEDTVYYDMLKDSFNFLRIPITEEGLKHVTYILQKGQAGGTMWGGDTKKDLSKKEKERLNLRR